MGDCGGNGLPVFPCQVLDGYGSDNYVHPLARSSEAIRENFYPFIYKSRISCNFARKFQKGFILCCK
jgi:hypothetical protein